MNELELLKKLVSFKTTTGNFSEIKKCLEFIEAFIRSKVKCKSEWLTFNKTQSLICRTQTNSPVSLVGHIDVVPTESKLFKLVVKNDKAWGRGVLDMKGPIVSLIFSFITLAKKGIPVELVLTSDEEIGGFNGAKALVKNKKVNSQIAIIPDGIQDFTLVMAQKAPLHIFISAKGQSAHASKPWEGKSAVEKILKCADEIISNFNLAQNEADWLSTAVLTQIKTNSAINQIPDEAEICIDLRVAKEKDKLVSEIKSICEKHRCLITKLGADEEVFTILSDTTKINLWKENVKKITKKDCREITSCGASDARHFPKETLTIITSIEGGGAHSNNEWINIIGLKQLEQVITQFILDLNPNMIYSN